MNAIESLLASLNERAIVRNVAVRHDEARMRYPLRANTVKTSDEFSAIIGDYCNSHLNYATGRGYSSTWEAQGHAKEILEREYQRRHGNLNTALSDAIDGTNGGLRQILDVLADALKAQSVERYTNEIFDAHVSLNSWPEKVAIVSQFIRRCGLDLSPYIDVNTPERYAQDWKDLIRAFIEGLRRTSSVFRRL